MHSLRHPRLGPNLEPEPNIGTAETEVEEREESRVGEREGYGGGKCNKTFSNT